MKDLLKRVSDNIAEGSLIQSGDRILVSFSGGPDSTALLYCLNKLKKELKFDLAACYINHNFRPRAAKKEIKFCGDNCERLNIPFILVEADVKKYAKQENLSLEEAGRRFRQTILQKIAGDEKCDKIALGHHLDDTIETILFRLFRGTGPGGLAPIKPISGKLIRPLYNIPKGDIVAFLKKHKIEYKVDRSNLESNFSRNYIRNKIIPLVEKHFGSKYKNSVETFAKIIIDENNFIRRISEKELRKICTITPGGKIIVDLPKFVVYDISVKRIIIKLLLEKIMNHPGAGSFEQVERILEVISGQINGTDLGGGIRAARERDNLIIAGHRLTIKRRSISAPATIEIPEISTAIRVRRIDVKKAVKKRQKAGNRINIDLDSIVLPLEIRGITAGDKFRPLGMKGTKKVGDYLTDKKCHRYIRDEIPVIKDKQGIIWLAGFEIADRVKLNNQTKGVMEIELIRRKDGL